MIRQKCFALTISLLLCAGLVFSGCQNPQQPTPPEQQSPALEEQQYPDFEEDYYPAQWRPRSDHTDFLWEVIGGRGRVYLMGTMHAVSRGYILTPELLDVFEEMDALALEINVLDVEDMMDMLDFSFLPQGQTVLDHLSERGLIHLENMIEVYGLDFYSIISMAPFTISSVFMNEVLSMSSLDIPGGVDLLLNLHAWEMGMEIYVLEDWRDVFNNVNNLPADTLERISILTIAPPEQSVEELQYLYEVFRSGDIDRVLALLSIDGEEEFIGGDGLPIIFEDIDERFDYYMLEHRDRIMADSIISYLESGRNVFVAAGLAHFIGENSIICFLEEAGYQVVRVDLTQRMAT